MRKLFIFALAGFLAQLVDITRNGIRCLLIIYIINIRHSTCDCFSNGTFFRNSNDCCIGYITLKFENVHKPTMLKLAIPGSISGFIGAALLTQIHGDYIKPYIALFLLSMGFIFCISSYLNVTKTFIHT